MPSCRSCSWYRKPEKPNQSHPIISLPLAHTEHSTLSIGCTDTTQKVSTSTYYTKYFEHCKFNIYIPFNNKYYTNYIKYVFRFLRYHRHCCWSCTNNSLLRLLLSLHHQGPKRKKTSASCLKHIKSS